MVILAFAALVFGAFLGRFFTAYSIVPGCCFAIVVGLAFVHVPPFALVVRIVALVVTVQLGYLVGLASTGLPRIRKASRARTRSPQPVLSPQDSRATIVAGKAPNSPR